MDLLFFKNNPDQKYFYEWRAADRRDSPIPLVTVGTGEYGDPAKLCNCMHAMLAFLGRFKSRFIATHWATRSPDLTVPDCFPLIFLKPSVYVNKSQTLVALKEKIC